MISGLIRLSIKNRVFVLFGAGVLLFFGLYVLYRTPVDALPDLSDTQVIIRTPYPGQAPRIVEDLVSYPLSRAMLTVPGARGVRAFSSYGDSFVYIIFDDDVDPYAARSRVLEGLQQARGSLPSGLEPTLGPDATGVGWIFEYALVDKSGTLDLGELRSLQDFTLKYELTGLKGVAEVASVGGAVKEYQVVLDPVRMSSHMVTLGMVLDMLKAANQEAGGSVVELAGAEYMVRASGYLKELKDFEAIYLKSGEDGAPVTLADVATIRVGPEMRRGIADLDGEGEVAGGIVLMRNGEDAREVIARVRERLETLKGALPEGVEVVTVYDRAGLIDRAIGHLRGKLIEEFIVVALTCGLFLLHFRSSLVAIVTLPLGLLISFIIMYFQGVSANIMSLGGLAIAIGTMVDASIVMVENAHKKLEAFERDNPGKALDNAMRWDLISEASLEVGPAICVSLLIITMSFIPVFSLEGQEGRLFSPLAFTKTYAMAGAAFLSITLIPVLMGLFIRGRIPKESENPVNRFLIRLYHPLLSLCLKKPLLTIFVAALVALSALVPWSRLGGEFLPKIDEGDLLYMPSALPGLSSSSASQLLQVTNKLIKTVPEVDTVFGKAGRAETATDPAPLEMIETSIHFKPRSEWRPGMTPDKLEEELDRVTKLPGIANLWVPPIRNRIDMISTGVKSPLGIRVSGSDIREIDQVALEFQEAVKAIPGVSSALAENLGQGRYIEIDIDRDLASRFGLTLKEAQDFVSFAVGGMAVSETVEGLARYPINVRYPQWLRDSPGQLARLPMLGAGGANLTLSEIAKVKVALGPSMLKSVDGRPTAWVYLDIRGRDIQGVVDDIKALMDKGLGQRPGVTVSFSGQYEAMERAAQRLRLLIPITLVIIFVLLYAEFQSFLDAGMIMLSLPFALTGAIYFMYANDYALSVAAGVGFIALAGLAAEFGVVMLMYLRDSTKQSMDLSDPKSITKEAIDSAIHQGAVLRVRPKAMTVGTIVISLIPIFWSDGAGSEVMKRIAAPLFGGMVTAFTLSMFILPAAWKLKLELIRRFGARRAHVTAEDTGKS
ncbi:MAG: CusA/CzcA family heavy metal efflux RND transporter [Deltaproteobacteria bacterium]|jgi:Cu(I)/Ag(I) efflux system membrane protein CusA/SilA|nr:CusA/CzcA family heavy metal efflux RND transporter [Deltaproteobacteria bacterium]